MDELIEVTQADRDAAGQIHTLMRSPLKAEATMGGKRDYCTFAQAFAAHRTASTTAMQERIDALEEALKWFVDRKWPIQGKFNLYGPDDTAAAMKKAFTAAEAALAAQGDEP